MLSGQAIHYFVLRDAKHPPLAFAFKGYYTVCQLSYTSYLELISATEVFVVVASGAVIVIVSRSNRCENWKADMSWSQLSNLVT